MQNALDKGTQIPSDSLSISVRNSIHNVLEEEEDAQIASESVLSSITNSLKNGLEEEAQIP
jgi:hypothetical protein